MIYDVTIVERITYTTTIEAESEEEALEIAEKKLELSDGPESAFGSPDYSETEIESATKRKSRQEYLTEWKAAVQ